MAIVLWLASTRPLTRKSRDLTIADWWWEEGIQPDEAMQAAIVDCFLEFMRYLDARRLRLGGKAAEMEFLLALPQRALACDNSTAGDPANGGSLARSLS